jgi:hypothetical protein
MPKNNSLKPYFKNKKIELKSPLELGNRRKVVFLKPFSGQLTDLNIWARPLTIEEMTLFSNDCYSESVKSIL